jgi:membrane-bound lytic murein transglycosylase B|uniref:Lytic murein transglycosylase n=1 Tax=Desulfobacca acetoxidans TaxID=60893 RepID=A0A7V6DQL5_9BACT
MLLARKWEVCIVLFIVCLCPRLGPGAQTPVAYVDLESQLIRQGLDKTYVDKVFADERNQFLPDIVRKIATLRKERPADYDQFLKPEVVARGRQYAKEHQSQLSRARDRYGVDPGVIVAILTVESGLGKATGKHSVFNVFASLSVMDTPEVIQVTGLPRYLYPRLKKKAAWARRELKIFLSYCQRNQLDPYQFYGSWAGAIGYPQFLPSSLVASGQDGDGDGRVDLFTHADAIVSIANYLKKSGFRQDSPSTWRRAILSYNNSEAYADTILTLARWY